MVHICTLNTFNVKNKIETEFSVQFAFSEASKSKLGIGRFGLGVLRSDRDTGRSGA